MAVEAYFIDVQADKLKQLALITAIRIAFVHLESKEKNELEME